MSPVGEVASGRVCASSLRSRLVFSEMLYLLAARLANYWDKNYPEKDMKLLILKYFNRSVDKKTKHKI